MPADHAPVAAGLVGDALRRARGRHDVVLMGRSRGLATLGLGTNVVRHDQVNDVVYTTYVFLTWLVLGALTLADDAVVVLLHRYMVGPQRLGHALDRRHFSAGDRAGRFVPGFAPGGFAPPGGFP